MKIEITFKDINLGPNGRIPKIAVRWDNQTVFQGDVGTVQFETQYTQGTLGIHFLNKTPQDTVCNEVGDIITDMNFTLDNVAIDEELLDDLLWDGSYHADNGDIYNSCLFFGPPGSYQCQITLPLLRWRLERNHRVNNNDPEWERDYLLYEHACNLLNHK